MTSTPSATRIRHRELDRALAHDLVRDFERAHDHAHAHALDRVFAADLARAIAYVLSLAPISVIDGSGVDLDTASASPSRGCRRLMALVVRVLPAGQRARYAEEFRTEMSELPHDEQLRYALRLLGRSWALRHALIGSLSHARVAETGEPKR